MRKYFLLVTMISACVSVYCAEQQNKRLLFPFPDKNVTDLWHIVRDGWFAHQYALESLPEEVNKRIAYFLLMLHNPSSFSYPRDQFFRKLLGCCVSLSYKEKAWTLPTDVAMSEDKKFYLYKRPDWNNEVMIHDKINNALIGKLQTWLLPPLKRENIVTIEAIKKNELYKLNQMISAPAISSSGKYVVGWDAEFCYVWNIIELDKIVCVLKQPSKDRIVRAAFSPDETHLTLFSNFDRKLQVLALLGNEVRELCNCYMTNVLNPEMYFAHNNEHLIIGTRSEGCVQGFRIKKNSDNSVALEQSFIIEGYICGKPCEDLFFLRGRNGQLHVVDYAGKVVGNLKDLGVIGHLSSPSGRHMYYYANEQGYKKHVMADLAYDENRKYCGIVQHAMNICDYHHLFWNKQETLMLRMGQSDGKYSWSCTDLNDKLLINFSCKTSDSFAFHPNGRALLCDCGLNNKKCVLYPKGADEHLKNLAHEPLTVTKCYALEKICGEVEKLQVKV